jgi:hypothetical protein
MKAESKFNIGDTIYYMYGEHPTKEVITGISFFKGKMRSGVGGVGGWHESTGDAPVVSYHVEKCPKSISELEAHATKEELQKSVFANLN